MLRFILCLALSAIASLHARLIYYFKYCHRIAAIKFIGAISAGDRIIKP
ncbi:hypothetical protein [Gloeocapsa sp. PCC 7428]|nr:hypothetical protein [Gloeocapsa sp. PCC 7428]